MRQIAFRVGPQLFAGDVVRRSGDAYVVEMHDGRRARVDARFRLRFSEDVKATRRPFGDVFLEAVASALRGGPLQVRGLRVAGLNRVAGGVYLGESTTLSGMADVLADHPTLGEHLALEAHRDALQRLGCIEGSASALIGGWGETTRPIHVFLEREPFRDVGLLRPGTPVEVTGYLRGCAVLEADGEEVYYPLESGRLIEARIEGEKDHDYYFSLDANKDGVPDPLQYLPSKAGVGQGSETARPEDNWNEQPYLPRVSGHFAAIPDITNPDLLDPNVVEGLGVLLYHHYAATPEDPAPGEQQIHKAVEALLAGAPVEALVEVSGLPTFEDVYARAYRGAFGRAPAPDVVAWRRREALQEARCGA